MVRIELGTILSILPCLDIESYYTLYNTLEPSGKAVVEILTPKCMRKGEIIGQWASVPSHTMGYSPMSIFCQNIDYRESRLTQTGSNPVGVIIILP